MADRWRLSAAGAVARADPESQAEFKALRVSELFEVREKDKDKCLGYLIWQSASAFFFWSFIKSIFKISKCQSRELIVIG